MPPSRRSAATPPRRIASRSVATRHRPIGFFIPLDTRNPTRRSEGEVSVEDSGYAELLVPPEVPDPPRRPNPPRYLAPKLTRGVKSSLSGECGEMSAGAITLCVMTRELPPTLRYMAQNQGGAVSRSQAIRAGLSPGMIKFRVRSGRWRQIHPGVYATFSGDLTRRTRLWAAVLSAGPGAALSHETAAELHRPADKPVEMIHLTVPAGRRVSAADRVRLHRSARVMERSRRIRIRPGPGWRRPCST